MMFGGTSCAQGRCWGDWVHCFEWRGLNPRCWKVSTENGAVDSIVWVRDVVTFGVNDKEVKGDTHRVPVTDHENESETIRIQDMGDASQDPT